MGTLIGGRYRLDEVVGHGASGSVWRAHDQNLGRDVVVKRLGMAPGADDPDSRRAQREAHLAASLNHPHIVAVFDLVDTDDGAWLVMEYVPGTDLASLVRAQGPLAPERAAAVLLQVADALAAAHAAGIVHRDVKPSNILLTPDGHAKLSDFGIARGTADASLTRTGLVTGSPAYLSPEVAAGASATPSSDAWALGATLYHLLAGRTPYATDSDEQHVLGTLYRIVNDPPPRLPGGAWPAPLLESLLVHDPLQRPSVAQVRDALRSGRLPATPLRPESTPEPTHEPTSVLTAPAMAAAPAEGTRTMVASAPVATPSASESTNGARRRPLLAPLLVLAAVVALVVIVIGVRALSGGAGTGGDTTASGGSSGGTGTSDGATSATTPSSAAVEAFARSYVETAASDPEKAYDLLTPAYQQASGGLDGYLSFWSRVVKVESIDDITADPTGRTVSYRYAYVLKGRGRVSENVRLVLEYGRDGSIRISGTA